MSTFFLPVPDFLHFLRFHFKKKTDNMYLKMAEISALFKKNKETITLNCHNTF